MRIEARSRFEPRLAVEMPQGWIAKEAVELFRVEGGAYVVAAGEPLPRGMGLEGYVDRYSTELRRLLPNMEELSSEPFEMFGGRKGWLRRYRWSPPERPGVRQLQGYSVEGGWGYVVTATVRDDDSVDEAEGAVLELMRDVRLKGHPASAAGRPYAAAGSPFDRFVGGEGFIELSDDAAASGAWKTARKGWLSTRERFA